MSRRAGKNNYRHGKSIHKQVHLPTNFHDIAPSMARPVLVHMTRGFFESK